VQSGEWSKLDSNSRKCICLGLESSVKCYRICDPISKKKGGGGGGGGLLPKMWCLMRPICLEKVRMTSIDNQKGK
jgi:hypothetical protein